MLIQCRLVKAESLEAISTGQRLVLIDR